MDLLTVFKQGDWILMGVFITLIIMSILTWTLIIIRLMKLYQAKKANKELQTKIWQAQNWEEVHHLVNNNTAPVAQITLSAIKAREHYKKYSGKQLGIACPLDEFLTRAIRRSLTEENSKFENGLTTLASIGATAPFIGLFGTVWGIYHALVNIGMSGQMSIAAVSGPIGEALIATAAGLAAAIPAVLAYNALSRSNKVLSRDLDHFAHDLHAQMMFPTE
ncbi:MotA/TolQ/ExbB proton channel family protein [Neisseria sp. Ec49-e6-T10]|uniref:MotA/TolQ/ExbB proton channel family protein n=1 Tax=Neisseria sp. Ec49-e6-T10 TaxID=3140744 RepID=UPI003EB7D2BA